MIKKNILHNKYFFLKDQPVNILEQNSSQDLSGYRLIGLPFYIKASIHFVLHEICHTKFIAFLTHMR